MDITYNKVDETALPISTNRVSANEYNQIAGSLMHIITTAGFTPDSQNNAQLLNALKQAIVNFPYITENYHNGTDWYRVWSDGWLEQGGTATNNASSLTVTFLKNYSSTDYYVGVYSRQSANDTGGYDSTPCEVNGNNTYDYGQAIDGFRCSTSSTSQKFTWFACGYMA